MAACAEDRTLTECGLMTSYALVLCAKRPDSQLILDRAMRLLRVELAHRLFKPRLIGSSQIVRAVHAEWNVDLLQRILFEYAESYDCLTSVIIPDRLLKGGEGEIERLEAPVGRRRDELSAAQASAQASAAEGAHDAELVSRVEMLESELGRLKGHRRRLVREVVVKSEWHAGAYSHAATLERELSEERKRNRLLEAELVAVCRELDWAHEDAAVDLALAAEVAVPGDVFAGRQVLLFTGHATPSTREEMWESFFECGVAQVDCYWTDTTRGPDSFPADGIVVIDVAFIAHSDSGARFLARGG